MVKRMNVTWLVVCCAVVSLGFEATCRAGILNGHAEAYNNISGSVVFDNTAGIEGVIDYAVFTAEAFNANFGGLGYVPSGGLVYAMQVANTGSVDLSRMTVNLAHAANTIGTFDIGDVDVSSAVIAPDADWTFASPIAPGETSWGLAFSSWHLPSWGLSRCTTTATHPGFPSPSPRLAPTRCLSRPHWRCSPLAAC